MAFGDRASGVPSGGVGAAPCTVGAGLSVFNLDKGVTELEPPRPCAEWGASARSRSPTLATVDAEMKRPSPRNSDLHHERRPATIHACRSLPFKVWSGTNETSSRMVKAPSAGCGRVSRDIIPATRERRTPKVHPTSKAVGGTCREAACVEKRRFDATPHLNPETFNRGGVSCNGSEAGSYFRLIDVCVTQL